MAADRSLLEEDDSLEPLLKLDKARKNDELSQP